MLPFPASCPYCLPWAADWHSSAVRLCCFWHLMPRTHLASSSSPALFVSTKVSLLSDCRVILAFNPQLPSRWGCDVGSQVTHCHFGLNEVLLSVFLLERNSEPSSQHQVSTVRGPEASYLEPSALLAWTSFLDIPKVVRGWDEGK